MASISPQPSGSFEQQFTTRLNSIPMVSESDMKLAHVALVALYTKPTSDLTFIPSRFRKTFEDVQELILHPPIVGGSSSDPERYIQECKSVAKASIAAKVDEVYDLLHPEVRAENLSPESDDDSVSSHESVSTEGSKEGPTYGERIAALISTLHTSEDVLEALNARAIAFRDIPAEWKGNKDLVLGYIRGQLRGQLDPATLSEVSEELQRDMDIVSEAVMNNSYCFREAREEFKKDKPFALLTVSRDIDEGTFQFFSEEVRADREVVLATVRHAIDHWSNGEISLLESANPRALANLEYVFKNIFPHIKGNLLQDKNFAIELVRLHRATLPFLSEELQHDPDVRRAAQ